MRAKGKVIVSIAAAVLAAAVVIRLNCSGLALMLGGYHHVKTIEQGFVVADSAHQPQPWQVVLAEKDGAQRLLLIEEGFGGFWPRLTRGMEIDGLEYVNILTVPPGGGFYGYDPTAFADSVTRTDNWQFAYQHITRSDHFYHGSNALKTLTVPEEALPRDCTLQIYQNGPEYVLHFSMYCKGEGAFEHGAEAVFRVLEGTGCIE